VRKREKLEVTLGDLIAALVDETVQFVPDEKAAHTLVAYILGDLLNDHRVASKKLAPSAQAAARSPAEDCI
jgi:hypothetical protein